MQLETERLLIRPFAPGDEADAIRFFTDPDFMAFSSTGVLSPEKARERFRGLIALYRARGFSKMALVERAGGHLVGYCGFGYEPVEGHMSPELGFRLMPQWQGRGLATEAARAVVSDAFARLAMTAILALVVEENLPSRGVLEKLGMQYQRRTAFYDREVMLYRLERSAFSGAPGG